MEKRFEHTEGPWVNEGRGSVSDTNGGNICTVFMGGARTGQDTANADRIVATVNGCDAAGVAEPGALLDLINAAMDAADRDPKRSSVLRAALRAVRGE